MSEGLKALEEVKLNIVERVWKPIEKELKDLEFIKKCFYVAKSSGAILLTDYGFEHKEELKEVLL